MFDKTGVKILGLIDNMSIFKGDDGKEYKIFGEGGVEKTAKEFNKQFLVIYQFIRFKQVL